MKELSFWWKNLMVWLAKTHKNQSKPCIGYRITHKNQ